MASTLRHGSHGHPLQLMRMSEIKGMATICDACGHYIKPVNVDTLYSCRSCGFHLHRCCALFSQSLLPSLRTHPTHHPHPLQFLYAPAYQGGAYQCNICWKLGYRFNYHCDGCSFDAHALCALMPLTISSHAHQHSLQLLFRPPVQGRTSCDDCRLSIDHCSYRCDCCNFDAHPGCLTKTQTQAKKSNTSKKVVKLVARKMVMHVVFGAFGLGEVMDFLFVGLEDLFGLEDLADDVSLPAVTFPDLPNLHGVDDSTAREFMCLLLENMEGIVGGDASSS